MFCLCWCVQPIASSLLVLKCTVGGLVCFLCVVESKNNSVLYKSRSISHSSFFSLSYTLTHMDTNQISIKTPLV